MGVHKEKSIKKKQNAFNNCILRLLEELERGDRTELQLVLRTTKEGYSTIQLSNVLAHLKSFEYITKYKPKKGTEKLRLDKLGRDKLQVMRESQSPHA